MISQELHWKCIEQRSNKRMRIRQLDRIEGPSASCRSAVPVGNENYASASRGYFLHIRNRLFEKIVARREDYHGDMLVDQRNRPVLQLACGITLGVNIGNLLEFQSSLERDRVVDPAAQIEHVTGTG